MNHTSLANQGSKYTDEVRRATLGVFVVTGNFRATSRKTGIPNQTISDWSKMDWWINLIGQVRAEKADELDAQVTNSISKAIDSVDKRLEHGDAYIIPKTGEIAYKPVSCRDSATVLGILYDKRQIMRLLPTSITTTTGSDKLLKLMENFEDIANNKIKEVEGTVVSEG